MIANKYYLALAATLLLSQVSNIPSVHASNTNPLIEVKLALKATKTINSQQQLKNKYCQLFSIKKSSIYNVNYIDSPSLSLMNQQKIVRIRNKESSDDVTYKYRFANQSIENTRQLAKQQRINTQVFAPQLDWGLQHKSMSFADKITLSKQTGKTASQLAKEHLPQNWMLPNNHKVFGQLAVTKYKGNYRGNKIDLEVWPLKSGPLVEVSYKTDKLATATDVRNQLIKKLTKINILAPDVLKTSQVLAEGPQQ